MDHMDGDAGHGQQTRVASTIQLFELCKPTALWVFALFATVNAACRGCKISEMLALSQK